MKKTFVFAMVAFFMILSTLSFAQREAPRRDVATPAIKVGVVDFQRVIRESRLGKSTTAVFMRELEARRAAVLAKEKDVLFLEAELKNPDPKWTPEVRKEKRERLEREVRDYRRMQSDTEEDMKKKEVEVTQAIIAEIREVVRNMQKAEGFTLILDRGVVLAYDEAIDVTGRVVTLYDATKK